MKVRDIISVIEDFAPLAIQESWDNSGLCVGSPEDEVTSVLLGLDCTPALVDEAVACGADMIVTHHPLIFKGVKKITPDDQTGEAIIKAIRAGISIYAAHTSADKVLAGVSGAMAQKLGLKNVRILDEDGEGTGLGTIGEFENPMTSEEVVALVKEKWSRMYADKELIIAKIHELAARQRASAYMNDIRWRRLTTAGDYSLIVRSYDSEVNDFVAWVTRRLDWMEEAIKEL